MKLMFLLIAALSLSACAPSLDGTYADQTGVITVTFKSNGRMSQSMMGFETEYDYKVEANKIKLLTPQGILILTLDDDGSIHGPMGITLLKRKK